MRPISCYIATTPIRDGGFGLYKSENIRPWARLASLLTTAKQIIERTSSSTQEGITINTFDQARFISEHIEKYFPFNNWGAFLPKLKERNAATSYEEYINLFVDKLGNIQSIMTRAYFDRIRDNFMNNPRIDNHFKTLIKSQAERGPNTLLTAKPSKLSDIYLHNDPYTAMCLYRLGNIIFPDANNQQVPCADCREHNDQFGVHCLHCRAGEHNATRRHNEIVRFLHIYCRKAGLAGQIEPVGLLNKNEVPPEIQGCRPDLIVYGLHGGKDFILDVKAVNLCAATYRNMVVNNTVEKALLEEHNGKLNKPQNRAFGNLRNSTFAPLVFSTTANVHSLTLPILEHMVFQMSIKSSAPYGLLRRSFFDTLYINILRSAGLMLHSKFILRDEG